MDPPRIFSLEATKLMLTFHRTQVDYGQHRLLRIPFEHWRVVDPFFQVVFLICRLSLHIPHVAIFCTTPRYRHISDFLSRSTEIYPVDGLEIEVERLVRGDIYLKTKNGTTTDMYLMKLEEMCTTVFPLQKYIITSAYHQSTGFFL